MTEDDEELLKLLVVWDYHRQIGNREKCQGKHQYESYTQAKKTLHHSRLKHLAHAYHCHHCGYWHVGGLTGTREHRLIKQRKKPK